MVVDFAGAVVILAQFEHEEQLLQQAQSGCKPNIHELLQAPPG